MFNKYNVTWRVNVSTLACALEHILARCCSSAFRGRDTSLRARHGLVLKIFPFPDIYSRLTRTTRYLLFLSTKEATAIIIIISRRETPAHVRLWVWDENQPQHREHFLTKGERCVNLCSARNLTLRLQPTRRRSICLHLEPSVTQSVVLSSTGSYWGCKSRAKYLKHT